VNDQKRKRAPVGADIGYHRVKVAFQTGTTDFPSLAGVPPADFGLADLAVANIPFHMTTPYDLLIGRAAALQGVGAPNLTPDWFESKEYFGLLMSALIGTGNLTNESILAVVGLPVDYMGLKGKLEAHYSGGHRVQFANRDFSQSLDLRVKVVSQGLGALATQIISDGGVISAGKQHMITDPEGAALIGLIDSGSGTTCFLAAQGLVTKADLTGSIPVAAWEIERLARTMIRDAYGPGLVSGMPRHALMDRLRLDTLMDSGKKVPTAQILDSACAIVAGKITQHLGTKWGAQARQMDYIYITGGGGILLEKHLQRAFPQARLIPDVDPLFANAIGYRRIAEMLDAQGR
jgi:hypothetical protein